MKVDKSDYLKHRTVCKNCHSKKRRKTNNNTLVQNQQHTSSEKEKFSSQHPSKFGINKPSVSAYESHHYVIIGRSNVGKTYYMLKKFEKVGNKDQFI